MRLETLSLKNYRSCYDTTVKFAEHVTLLVGENDAGKSTIINQLQIQPLAGFAMLHTKYLLNLPRLIPWRHVLVDDADTAFLRERDREARLGHRVHGGRNDGDIEREGAGQLGLEQNFAGQDVGVRRL